MASPYNEYYKTENLFGAPYPELIHFFSSYTRRGRVLDIGCGQGRDAIPLARLGYTVVGIDHAKLGIEQMLERANTEHLPLTGVVSDIYEWDDFSGFDFILLDSMFHFSKKDIDRESRFIKKILANSDEDCHIVFCIQDTGKKVQILTETLKTKKPINWVLNQKMEYIFEDQETGHTSKSNYRMIILRT